MYFSSREIYCIYILEAVRDKYYRDIIDGILLKNVYQFEQFFEFNLLGLAILESLEPTLVKVKIIIIFCYLSGF